jgi:ubiquinone/menaquinone biosynthesis C-methylase UbiE
MRSLLELPAWDRLFKRIVWQQMGDISGKRILDFGSGEGITADHFAANNEVIAIEPSEDMLANAWKDNKYEQIVGDVSSLSRFVDNSFDMIICHNVLEYIDNKKQVITELSRLLKTGGILSLVKHNRAGRVMQMAVLLDDFDRANALLDRKDGSSTQFGAIRYYDDEDISKWNRKLKLIDTFGIRTFWDLQQNQEKHNGEEWQLKMVQLENRVSKIQEYRDIAFFHHLIFVKE